MLLGVAFGGTWYVNGSADGWFFDGHAEAMREARLTQLGIKALFGPDPIPSYYYP